MAREPGYRMIAAFYLTVFSLQAMVGLACSLGVDMIFNSAHHEEEATEAVVHIHADGKRHIHYEKKKHDHDKSHGRDQSNDDESSKGKKNCCNDQVYQFQKLDKSLPHSVKVSHPNFLITSFDVFYNVPLPMGGMVKDIRQFVRGYHPPIPDIRIAIQSFQI